MILKAKKKIITIIETGLPEVLAIYLFGLQNAKTANQESDVDLALFCQKLPDAEAVFKVKMELSHFLKKDVDIVFLLQADDVTRMEILKNSEIIYNRDKRAVDFFETHAMAKYAQLNLERKEIIGDIVKRGFVKNA